MNSVLFSARIISWYEENKRNLPWRNTSNPYKIWLSEIMLQQTRVAQGLPYYNQFIAVFPTVAALAKAPADKVMRLWQGLGYYSRARNLHACAKVVQSQLGGNFPNTYKELIKLPGIGTYTAAAIASISFGEAVAVVDGNVFRVLARVYGIDKDIASPEGKKFFFEKANEIIPEQHPALFNQAIMEFGALYCTPKNPKCDGCIFVKSCVAHAKNLQSVLPVKSKKLKVRKRYFTYWVIVQDGKVFMRKREAGDIWNGLYDFYLTETTQAKKITTLQQVEPLATFRLKHTSKVYKHLLSHQQLWVQFAVLHAGTKKIKVSWLKENHLKPYSIRQIQNLPKPILIKHFLDEMIDLE